MPGIVFGTPADDVISSFSHVRARGGDDLIGLQGVLSPTTRVELRGQAGDDRIFCSFSDLSASNSFLFGGLGDDEIQFEGGVASGGLGRDLLRNVRDNADTLNATLRGGAGDDLMFTTIDAGSGVDVMRGGDGNDYLEAFVRPGTARARMIGGEGADIFFAEGPVVVVDFSLAEGDRILLSEVAEDDPSLIRQEVIETDRGVALLLTFPVAQFPATFTLYGIDQPLPDRAFF